MEIRIRQSGAVLDSGAFRALYPNVSFPAILDAAALEPFGADLVFEASAPAAGPFQSAQRNGIAQDDQGRWAWAWVLVDLDAPAVAAIKAQAWERIKAKRDSLQSDGGVNVGGKWFLSNDREQGRYNSLIAVAAAMGLPGTTVLRAAWRTMQDGVTQDMTANLARSILTGGFSQFAAIDDAAQAHKVAMEASADPAAYDFSAGWPATFQG